MGSAAFLNETVSQLAEVSLWLNTIYAGGYVERTIEYVAPFDRCDREQDYETAWNFFEKKYRKE